MLDNYIQSSSLGVIGNHSINNSIMDLSDLKSKFIREELEINCEYGKIISFIDFGNVNNWFGDDRQDWNNNELKHNEALEIDIEKLKEFAHFFSDSTRCYYGMDSKSERSRSFNYAMERVFGRHNFVSKDMQRIKHYLNDNEKETLKLFNTDCEGRGYVEIKKCNFDVELSVDAIKKIDKYDTFCLFSGDADFVYLNTFLRKRGKKIIIIKGGYITTKLRETADLVINAQNIKKYIARIKQKPD